MEKWLGIITFAFTIAGLIWGASKVWEKMNNRMTQVEKKQAGQEVTLQLHSQAIGSLETAIHVLGQQMTDHNERDDERFGRIDNYMNETRKDIKEILRAVGGKA